MASGTIRSRVLGALGNLLGPIVLLLLKSGVTWREFSDLAKAKFVEVATREFGIRGRPTNASRVAILTGLDRRDVRKLRLAIERAREPGPGFMSKPSQVLDGWFHDPEFTQASGPRELALDDGAASFPALVRRYAPGIPPVAMIKELESAGAIVRVGRNRLRAVKRTYIPRELSDNQIRLWGSVLQDVAATLEHNITRGPAERTRFERRALNLAIDRRAVPEFERFLAEEGQAFLERIDNWLAAHQVDPSAADGHSLRLGAGIYQITDHSTPLRQKVAKGRSSASE